MRIIEIRLRLVDADGLSFSLGPGFRLGQELLLVELRTDEGLAGLGGTSTYGNGRELLESIRSSYAPMVLGRDPLDTEGFWRQALALTKLYGAPQAAAAIDLAMWDLIGRALGQPAYRLLGTGRDRIPVYASLPVLDSVEAHLETVAEWRERGIGAFKIHLSGIAGADIDLARRLREQVGDGVALLADAVGHYDYPDALRVGRALEEADFEWFEMPLEDFYGEGYRRLNQALRIPVTTGEVTNSTLFESAEAIIRGEWDIVRVDVANWGGLTQGRKVSALAQAFGLRCEFHSWGFAVNQFANLHAMLPAPNAKYFEWPVPSAPFEFGFAPVRIVDGVALAPDAPGLGLEPDEDRLGRHELASLVLRKE